MSIVLSLLAQALHLLLMMIVAPTAAGAADWLEARFAKRAGPPVLLAWRDLVRLSRKTSVQFEGMSVVSVIAPKVCLGATVSAAVLVPSFTLGMALSPLADLLVVISLMIVARLARAIAALDCGAALPGLAAQQDSAMAVLAEPALMLFAFTMALMAGSFNLEAIMIQQHDGLLAPTAAAALALTVLLALAFVDCEVGQSASDQMLGGTDLALSQLAAWLRRLVWIDLIGGLFLPMGIATADAGLLSWLIGLVCWLVKVIVFTLGLAALRTFMARISRRRMLDLAGMAALLALLATIMALTNSATT